MSLECCPLLGKMASGGAFGGIAVKRKADILKDKGESSWQLLEYDTWEFPKGTAEVPDVSNCGEVPSDGSYIIDSPK